MRSLLTLHLRQAVRGLRRNPTFTIAVLLTLALAIGANTAVFSVVNGVLINPLPYPEPESLISVLTRAPGAPNAPGASGGIADMPESASMYVTYAENNRVLPKPRCLPALPAHGRRRGRFRTDTWRLRQPRRARDVARAADAGTRLHGRGLSRRRTRRRHPRLGLLAAEIRRRPFRRRPDVDERFTPAEGRRRHAARLPRRHRGARGAGSAVVRSKHADPRLLPVRDGGQAEARRHPRAG